MSIVVRHSDSRRDVVHMSLDCQLIVEAVHVYERTSAPYDSKIKLFIPVHVPLSRAAVVEDDRSDLPTAGQTRLDMQLR